MFIRQFSKTEQGKRVSDWALVDSYGAERGSWHRVVVWLGKLDEAGRLSIKRAADEASPSSQRTLFPDAEPEPEWLEVEVKKREHSVNRTGLPLKT